ncbi:MAG: hypothetical protein AVDCRST_MAG32-3156, partial [uncultured Nocardioides sp.]
GRCPTRTTPSQRPTELGTCASPMPGRCRRSPCPSGTVQASTPRASTPSSSTTSPSPHRAA